MDSCESGRDHVAGEKQAGQAPPRRAGGPSRHSRAGSRRVRHRVRRLPRDDYQRPASHRHERLARAPVHEPGRDTLPHRLLLGSHRLRRARPRRATSTLGSRATRGASPCVANAGSTWAGTFARPASPASSASSWTDCHGNPERVPKPSRALAPVGVGARFIAPVPRGAREPVRQLLRGLRRVASARELRCDCGKLLARVVHSVLELKCSRCKRAVLVMDGWRFEAAGAGSCTCAAKPSPVM